MDDTILERARLGDDGAFDELVAPYRRELLVHCYRSLGSFHDAEDVLQEVLVSAWRALDSFDGKSLRGWLYRIATNRCLNHLRDNSRRPQPANRPDDPAGIGPAGDPWWLEPFPDTLLGARDDGPEARYDTRESIALAFVAGLQKLPPKQRAVLVLRDVLGFPAAEAAEILGTTAVSINSALVRARDGFRPHRSPEDVPLPRSSAEAAVAQRFADAFQHGDLERVLAILSDDARLSMPPEPIECNGALAVADYLRWRGFWGPDLQLVPTRANGQPAYGYYLPDPVTSQSRANGLIVLTIDHDHVTTVTRFGGPRLVTRFGLPEVLPHPSADAPTGPSAHPR
ncbi:MAG: RNA polymerase subunit sigma-70 [Acidimicrobiales bacterium]